MSAPFVPQTFDPPAGLTIDDLILEPLGPQHNERDHRAWMSSIDHIHTTAGFQGTSDPWPVPMTLDENRADLEEHAMDFATRTGFTYTVLDPASRDVLGCVYIYPSTDGQHDASVRSWIRLSHAHLDPVLRLAVAGWLDEAWPFRRPDYAVA